MHDSQSDAHEPLRQQPVAPEQPSPQGAPLFAPPARPGGSYPPQPFSAPKPNAPEQSSTPRRPNGLFTGLAVGALVGALAGGATGAIVASNTGSIVTPQQGGSFTITNPNPSTEVNAIAQVATVSTVTIDVASPTGAGSGSGVIYSEDGYIITNAHVVTMPGSSFQQTNVRVFLNDGRILPAQIVGTDPYADIAVVKVEAEGLTPINVGTSSELQVGDLTVAIGAPFDLSSTVTSGVISALNRGISVGSPLLPTDDDEVPDRDLSPFDFRFNTPGEPEEEEQPVGGQVTLPVIQTDADINPGNSGGPLLNGAGELIGINVAIASTGGRSDTAGSVGLGFAIPVDLAVRVSDSIIAGEAPTHGLLGAVVQDSRATETAAWRGGLVLEVTRGGAADRAGIRPGDIITGVEGISTVDGTAVSAIIRFFAGETEVTVDLVRDGRTQQVEVTLGTLTL